MSASPSANRSASRHPEASLYRRNAARITTRVVLHTLDKQAAVVAAPQCTRRRVRHELDVTWAAEERLARAETERLLATIRDSVRDLATALDTLAASHTPELIGTVATEQQRVTTALSTLDDAAEALRRNDFGGAGAAVQDAERELWRVGGPLVVALNQALSQAAVGREHREHRERLDVTLTERRTAKKRLEATTDGGQPATLEAAAGCGGRTRRATCSPRKSCPTRSAPTRPPQPPRSAGTARSGSCRRSSWRPSPTSADSSR